MSDIAQVILVSVVILVLLVFVWYKWADISELGVQLGIMRLWAKLRTREARPSGTKEPSGPGTELRSTNSSSATGTNPVSILAGDNSTIIVTVLTDRLVDQNPVTQRSDSHAAPLDDDIAKVKRDLLNVLARLDARTKQGDASAKAVLDDAYRTGTADAIKSLLQQEVNSSLRSTGGANSEQLTLLHEVASICYLADDFDNSERYLKKILELSPRDTTAINRLGHIYEARGEYTKAKERFEQLLQIADNLQDRAAALGNLSIIDLHQRRLNDAEERAIQALHLCRNSGRTDGIAASYNCLGLIEFARNDINAAQLYFRGMIRELWPLRDREGIAAAITNIGICRAHAEQWIYAKRRFTFALHVRRRLNRRAGIASTLMHLASVEHNLGNSASALRYAQEAHKMFAAVGMTSKAASALVFACTLQLKVDVHFTPATALAIARPLIPRIAKEEERTAARANLGAELISRGDLLNAESLIELSLDEAKHSQNTSAEAIQLANLGLLRDRQDRTDDALLHYHSSLKICMDRRDLAATARVLSRIGDLHYRQKQFEAAIYYGKMAFAIYFDLQHTRGMAASLLNLGITFRGMTDYSNSQKHISIAHSVFMRIRDFDGITVSLDQLGDLAALSRDMDRARSMWGQALVANSSTQNATRAASILSKLG